MLKIPVCKECNLVAWTDNLCLIHLNLNHHVVPIDYPRHIKTKKSPKPGIRLKKSIDLLLDEVNHFEWIGLNEFRRITGLSYRAWDRFKSIYKNKLTWTHGKFKTIQLRELIK